ncbi:MAG TPA: ABC transporter permease subunit, partial [Limnochordia bacterium]|nr:ABC transporter permease subunit [Limnochordia bacterium]
FLKKELIEYARTYKLLIMLTVFMIFGITNPLIAKLTPELLTSFMPEGMLVTIPEPTALDSWAQFFKNTQQMGMIVLVLVFSGVLSNELSRGTLINLLTKGLPREAVILSKYLAMLLVWTVSVLLSSLLTLVYTLYLFPGDQVHNLVFAVFCMWLFGAFLLAVLLSSATLVSGNYGSLLLTGLAAVVLLILNIIPGAAKFNPISLATRNMELAANAIEASALYTAVGITGLAALGLLTLAVLVFRKKRL